MEKNNQESISYEFELEEEQRIMINPGEYRIAKWINHVVDTYDQSGRCRIRLKNGQPRLSIKVPLFSRDTDRTKCCIRLEFKPKTEKQKQDLLKIRELILKEPGTQTAEKWGTPLKLSNDEKVWINKDAEGNYWIEADESKKIEKLLPEGMNYLKHIKSSINPACHAREMIICDFDKTEKLIRENLEITSRTAKGKVDTSVSGRKKKTAMSEEEISLQVKINSGKLIRYIKTKKDAEISGINDAGKIVYDIAEIINSGISEDPCAYRSWTVQYGRQVTPERIPDEMETFLRELCTRLKEAENGELDPGALGRWIELEMDRNIHAFEDGCGRIAKSLSAFFFTRLKRPLPFYISREKYYNAMNKGEEKFREYYSLAIKAGLDKFYPKS